MNQVAPESETARRDGPDSVGIAFADPGRGLFGLARILLVGDCAHGAGLLVRGGEVLAAASGTADAAPDAAWSSLEAGPVRHGVTAPSGSWRVAFDGGDGGSFELELRATGPAASFDLGALAGREQLCEVAGTVTARSARTEVRCPGQRGHAWATRWSAEAPEAPGPSRRVGLWREDGEAVLLAALRPRGAAGHEQEAIAGFAVVPEPAERGGVHPIQDARLSTTWDGAGRVRRAGLELWPTEEAQAPRRAAGQAVCGAVLSLGAAELECAFLDWRMEGRAGPGFYEALRPAS